LPPEKLSGGGFRIWIAATDGTPLDSSSASRIEVHSLLEVNQTLDNATRLNSGLSVSDGLLWLDDLASPASSVRFYRVIERMQ
jgi:hypothetical protein